MNPLTRIAASFRLAVATLAGVIAMQAHAQIAVSPQLLDLDPQQAASTNAFRIYNETSETKRVRVSVSGWNKDEKNQVRDLAPTATSLERWAIVSPTEFELAPGKAQAVRIAIRPPTPLPPGEHRLMLYFNEETPIPAADTKTTLHVRFRIGSAIYIHSGTVERRGVVHGVKAAPQGLAFDLETTGNATTRLAGHYVVYPQGRAPEHGESPRIERLGQPDMPLPMGAAAAGALPGESILPGDRRTIRLDLGAAKLAPGRYTVVVDGRYGDTPIATRVEYTVATPAKGR